jgi:hypothetical protein
MAAMGAVKTEIDDDLAAWIAAQQVFFVATAPLAAAGHVNCSPRGMDSLRVLDARRLAWRDLTGSGVETISHLRENRRITLMWCAFAGEPRIARVHGQGLVHLPGSPDFAALEPRFPPLAGTRAIIEVVAGRVSASCGFAVPRFDFVAERSALTTWADKKGEAGLAAYRAQKNRSSIDGLPGL